MTAGIADMATNAQGVLVEKELGRSVMSSFHGCWSAGVLAGSGVSATTSRRPRSRSRHDWCS